MKILTLTKRNDTHARVVHACLSELGVESQRWFGNEFPAVDCITTELSGQQRDSVRVIASDAEYSLLDADVVWFRRPGSPTLPSNIVAPDDAFVERENVAYFRSIYALLSQKSFWINSYQSRQLADQKLLQLSFAAQCGFQIPDTIVTNSSEQIRRFAAERCAPELMFKSFTPIVMGGGLAPAMLYASKVRLSELDRPSIRNSAGIWQTPVPKLFEVRAVFLGHTCFAAKIDSQSSPLAKDDWRRARGRYRMEEFSLDFDTTAMCISLMEKLGIVFGCFDFIMTPDGRYTFLEVNEMGQFLWLEERLPEMPLLDAFIDFITHPSKEYKYYHKPNRITLRGVYESETYKLLDVSDRLMFETK